MPADPDPLLDEIQRISWELRAELAVWHPWGEGLVHEELAIIARRGKRTETITASTVILAASRGYRNPSRPRFPYQAAFLELAF